MCAEEDEHYHHHYYQECARALNRSRFHRTLAAAPQKPAAPATVATPPADRASPHLAKHITGSIIKVKLGGMRTRPEKKESSDDLTT